LYVQHKTSIRAVVFDVDGTLYPAHSLYMRCIDIFFAHPRVVTEFAVVRKKLRSLQMEHDYTPQNGEDLHSLQASLMARGLGIDQARARELMEQIFYLELPKRFASIRPYPEVRTAIEKIRDSGMRVAALSDLPPQEKIAALGLSDILESSFCAEDAGVLKPHPRAFGGVAEALDTDFPEILYVGNNTAYDIDGPKRVGMRAARRGRRFSGADFSFSQWRQLADWVLADGDGPQWT
jgi:Predicted hydrolase (HAD superfamily)